MLTASGKPLEKELAQQNLPTQNLSESSKLPKKENTIILYTILAVKTFHELNWNVEFSLVSPCCIK